MERKRNKKPHYYFTFIPISFPLGALPLGYHFPVSPNMKKFCDKNFCRNSTNKERLHLEETQIESDSINEEMNEDSCELEVINQKKLRPILKKESWIMFKNIKIEILLASEC
ncbi:hypothetical protein RhiirA5_506893 [Rhizophagus irregularis]|uniref:Uncharacterized protein n=1 Tax=Rhizophagus irregularis TaxID=588596 RepID=A0A2N0NPX9_9GLOM|nr:hypothetical protein RhiirA5_506893 [Rhizophagus irregularis]PKC57419.1 hypothetical protein RhiirA1_541612 [Rhizophagus irregularis]